MISIYEIHTSMEGVGINMCLGAKKRTFDPWDC
jgi:hypothetical protein